MKALKIFESDILSKISPDVSFADRSQQSLRSFGCQGFAAPSRTFQPVTGCSKRLNSMDTCCAEQCSEACPKKHDLALGKASTLTGLRVSSDTSVKDSSALLSPLLPVENQVTTLNYCGKSVADPAERQFLPGRPGLGLDSSLTHSQDKHSKYEFISFTAQIDQRAANYRFNRKVLARVIRPQSYAGYTHAFGIKSGTAASAGGPSKFECTTKGTQRANPSGGSSAGPRGHARRKPGKKLAQDKEQLARE